MNKRVRRALVSGVLVTTSAVGTAAIGSPVEAANGCGAEGGLSAVLVPNGVPGIYNFTAACNTHDNCYSTIGASQAGCDSQFREDMLASCGGGVVCGIFAELYAAAVRNFGESAFTEAQMQAQHEFAVSDLVRVMEEEGMVTPEQANEILEDHGLPTNPIDVPADAEWYDGYDWYSETVPAYDDYGYNDDQDYGYNDYGYDDFGGVNDGFDSWGDVGDLGGGWGDSGGDWGGGGGGGGGDEEFEMMQH